MGQARSAAHGNQDDLLSNDPESAPRTTVQFVGHDFGAIDQLRARLEEVGHLAPQAERDFVKGLGLTFTLSRGVAVFLVQSADEARAFLKSVEILGKLFAGGKFGLLVVARTQETALRQALSGFKAAKVLPSTVGVNELHDLLDQALLRIGVASCKVQGRGGSRSSNRAGASANEKTAPRTSGVKRTSAGVLVFKGSPLAGFNVEEEASFSQFYGARFPVEFLEKEVLYLRNDLDPASEARIKPSFQRLVSTAEKEVLLDEAREREPSFGSIRRIGKSLCEESWSPTRELAFSFCFRRMFQTRSLMLWLILGTPSS